jgi:hypothetical protein
MTRNRLARLLLAGSLAICLLGTLRDPPVPGPESDVVALFKRLTKSSEWRLTSTIEMKFRTYHPQGMVIIREHIFFSAVEIIQPTEKYPRAIDGYDRTPGKGIGHLFKVDREGKLIAEVKLGEGNMYHVGGIDYDGKYIWIPGAEYRPRSESIIYRVDSSSLEVTEVFRFKDHIGDILHNTVDGVLHGVSWGSRSFYTWRLNDQLNPISSKLEPYVSRNPNGNHYIDYQDCHYLRDSYALCGGVNLYSIPVFGQYALGGLDLIELRTQRAIHQIPVAQWVNPSLVMTFNPFFVELEDDHLRFYFMPEDDESKVYVYDILN